MIARAGCVFQSCRDVTVLEKGLILKDFLSCRARSQEIKDIAHANTKSAKTWAPIARDPT